METNAARTPPRFRGAGRLAAKLCLAALSTLGIGLAATSCSLIVDSNGDQCTADADCDKVEALKGRTCNAGLCVANVAKCMTNADCPASADSDRACGKDGVCVNVTCLKNQTCANKNGPNSVCRKNECVSLVSDLCKTVYSSKDNHQEAYLDENAFFFGSIIPAAMGDEELGLLFENAVKLALDDFKKVNGIPAATGTEKRPLVLIGCTDGPNEDTADTAKAANHLIDDLGITAIIGYPFSGNTIKLATDVTIPKGVLLFSPSATSNDITLIKDNDLLWRTSPPDSFQAAALSTYLPEVEARARGLFPTIPANGLKVVIIHNNDSYGAGLAESLQSQLTFNGKTALSQLHGNFENFDYGDPATPDLGIQKKVTDFGPHVIFVFGFGEGVDTFFTGIESKWVVPADGHKPMWVFSEAGEVDSLWNTAIGTDGLRQRVSGSTPGVLKDNYPPYANFIAKWDMSSYSKGGTVSADTLGPAGAYDITYLLAYAAVAVGTEPTTGANLAKLGLRKMVPPPATPTYDIGSQKINEIFDKLQAGVTINVQGASGPLDFDKNGEALSDIQIWCVPPGVAPKVASAAFNSGRYYNATEKKMDGVYDAKCMLP